jgi:hypothetical protein
VAVKGAKYVLATYLKIELGAIKLKPDEKRSTYLLKSLLPLAKDAVMKMNGMNVGGYRLSIPSSVGTSFRAPEGTQVQAALSEIPPSIISWPWR